MSTGRYQWPNYREDKAGNLGSLQKQDHHQDQEIEFIGIVVVSNII